MMETIVTGEGFTYDVLFKRTFQKSGVAYLSLKTEWYVVWREAPDDRRKSGWVSLETINEIMNVLFDIDGTLANIDHRIHLIKQEPKDWKAFGEASKDDVPITPLIETVNSLIKAGHHVDFCTGRMEHHRSETNNWLIRNISMSLLGACSIWMRAQGDYRTDDIVKSEILDYLISIDRKPDLVFEDRQRVVDMWRARGIVCCQVAPGNF